MNKPVCFKCNKCVDFEIVSKRKYLFINGIQIWYDDWEAHCKNCGSEVWVSEVDDHNAEEPWKIYKKITRKR